MWAQTCMHSERDANFGWGGDEIRQTVIIIPQSGKRKYFNKFFDSFSCLFFHPIRRICYSPGTSQGVVVVYFFFFQKKWNKKFPRVFYSLKEEEDGWMDWFRCCGFIIIAMWEKGKKERKKSNVKRILNISKGPCCVCANNRTKRTDRRTRRQGPPFVIPIERHNKTTRSSVFILFFFPPQQK